MDTNAKYTIKDLAGRIIATANDSSELEKFWNGVGLNYSVVDYFGSKRTKIVFIVKEIK
jgi:hypothetical protein